MARGSVDGMKIGFVDLENGDGTTLETIVTGAHAGCRVFALFATSTEVPTDDRLVEVWLGDGTTDYLADAFKIPDGSGFNGTDQAVNIMPLGLSQILLPESHLIKVKVQVAVTAGKKVCVTALYEEYDPRT